MVEQHSRRTYLEFENDQSRRRGRKEWEEEDWAKRSLTKVNKVVNIVVPAKENIGNR